MKQGVGEVSCFKARLLAKGFLQKCREDFDETFAPVVKCTTIKMLLSVVASRKMRVKYLQVKTVFLHGEIAKELYMELLSSFINQMHPGFVCKLKRGLC